MSEPLHVNKKRKNKVLAGVALFFCIAGGGVLAYNYFIGAFHETTDNAYIQGELYMITPQTSGVVQEVYVQETQSVKKGEPLVVLDDRDASLALDKAKESLALSVREIVGIHKRVEESQATLNIAKKELQEAKDDLARREMLVKSGAISQEELSHMIKRVEKAQDALIVNDKHRATLESAIQGLSIEENPSVKLAATRVEEALLALKRCRIIAPCDGIVAKKNIQPGQKVNAGQSVMGIVASSQFWVDANFKETQLSHIRIGQPVVLYADLYGKDEPYHGKVEGISPGTGSSFALIPAQNASGNWIKIVQRIPVRISLEPKEMDKKPLHVGLSMNVDVDTHERNGTNLMPLSNAEKSLESSMYDETKAEALKLIQQIIVQNK